MTYQNIFIDGIMHMGDMIMTASVMPVLRKHCPEAKITYLCSAKLAFVAEMLEGIDEVLPYSYKSKGGYMDVYHWGKRLEQNHYDLGISLDPRERVTLMKWFANMPERISLEQALGWKLGWEKWLYTKDLALPDGWHYQDHSMAASFQQLMRSFFHDPETRFERPRFRQPKPEEQQWVQEQLKTFPTRGKKIALCVETTTKTKDWPVEKFSQLCDQLAEQYDATLVFTGIAAHKPRVQAIMAGMQHKDRAVDLAGVTSFPQLAALLSSMDLLVSLDTGTAHIGAAAGCPVVTIFTHNSPIIYQAPAEHSVGVSGHLPCSGKHVCIGPSRCSKTDCVDVITVPMVAEAIEQIFKETL